MNFFISNWWALLLIPVGIFIAWRLHRSSFAGPNKGWRRTYLILRCLVVIFLALALSDPQARREGDTRAVIAVVDRSRSMPADLREQAEHWLRTKTETLTTRDKFGVVLFGGDTSIEFLPDSAPPDGAFNSIVDTDGTDIAAALRVAASAFPKGAAKRILLVSDGNETKGDAEKAARDLKDRGIRVDVLPVRYSHDNEVSVEQVVVPTRTDENKPVEIRVIVRSSVATEGTLNLRHNGALVATQNVELKPGKNQFILERELKTGFHQFSATVDAKVDGIAANNRGFGFTLVAGEPRVLLVESDPAHATQLVKALEPHGVDPEVVDPSGIPIDVGAIQNYDLMILSNVPAMALSTEQMSLIQGAVRDLGMGLIMIGGEQSFASGGWLGTPVEEALPVDMEIRQKRVLPNGALALIMHTCEFDNGNSWAKKITKEAIRVLSRQDYVGVLYYGFAGGDKWLFPMTKVGDKKGALLSQVDRMSPGDMPAFHPTMNMAYQGLMKTNTSMRHVVVVSDGDASPPQPGLVALMQKNKISVTGIEIFPHGGAFGNTLANLAKATGGQHYTLSKPGDEKRLPRILIKEALTVRRSHVSEKTFKCGRGHPTEVIDGFDVKSLPPLHGYVICSPKDEAFVPLKGPEQDPILAHWQYGLGRSLAFTSDAKNRWAASWLGWGGFSKFWSQAVRWTSRNIPRSNFRMTMQPEGKEAKIVLDAIDADGQYVNDLKVRAHGRAPDGSSLNLPLAQTSAGRYEATVPLEKVGVYVLNTVYESTKTAKGEQAKKGRIVGGLAVNYSPEYASRTADVSMLTNLAQMTGGRKLSALIAGVNGAAASLPADPLFVEEERVFGAAWALWPALLTTALLLFLLDVALRRIQIDLRPARRAVAGVFDAIPGLGAFGRMVRPARRTGEALGTEVAAGAPAPVQSGPTWKPDLAHADAAPPPGAAGATADTAATDAPAPAPAEEEGGLYTRRLLDAKRRKRRALPKKRGKD
ncbi:MAG: VWA domain-containing protein [Planctomycetota bacterium]|jgi:uncharacterized membrane protein/Mg-chelatase subunit ChlD